MNESDGNPPGNRLAAGLSDEALSEAVESSGYPLQTVVAAQLSRLGFSITEEWVFTDSESGKARALDVHAAKPLYDRARASGSRVRPALALLIECKQSEMPYVFFESDTRPGLGGAALSVAGLHTDEIVIRTDDDPSSWLYSVTQALDLHKHAFAGEPARVALSFSKAVRKGKDVQLSGADPYQSLVLPLSKALGGYPERVTPPKTAVYFDVVLPIGIAVIDGPMVLATVSASGVTYELTPWIRVYRNDVDPPAAHEFDRDRLYAIDCIHADWLETYISGHLQPFADEFGVRALRHAEEIATGVAFAPGMGSDSWGDVEGRLRPRGMSDRARRPATIVAGLRRAASEFLAARRG